MRAGSWRNTVLISHQGQISQFRLPADGRGIIVTCGRRGKPGLMQPAGASLASGAAVTTAAEQWAGPAAA
jgi:hypothetical protein